MLAVALLAALAFGGAHDVGASRSVAAAERFIHIGQIYITGADDMSASAVLNELKFQTGERIPVVRLREAERRLDRLGLFVVDQASRVRPVIAELPDGEVTDLRITVKLRTRP